MANLAMSFRTIVHAGEIMGREVLGRETADGVDVDFPACCPLDGVPGCSSLEHFTQQGDEQLQRLSIVAATSSTFSALM